MALELEVDKEGEKIAYFFNAGTILPQPNEVKIFPSTYPNHPIGLPIIQQLRLFDERAETIAAEVIARPSEGKYTKAEYFSRNHPESARTVIKYGLSYCARMRFINFGINSVATYREEAQELARLHDKKTGQRTSKHRRIVPVVNPIILESRREDAERFVDEWTQSGVVPEKLHDFYVDVIEPFTKGHNRTPEQIERARYYAQKVCYKLGRIVYKIKDNKDFGAGTIKRIEEAHKVIEEKRTSRADWMEQQSRKKPDSNEDPFSIEDLENIVNDMPGFSKMDREEEREVKIAAPFIAEAAHEIRNNYKEKGREVRDGLIKKEDRDELLFKSAKKMRREKGFTLFSTIKRIAYNRLGQLVCVIGRLPSVMYSSPIIEASREDYTRIGLERWSELCAKDGQKAPYKLERPLFTKILEYRLNQEQFRRTVNDWLTQQGKPEVDWAKFESAA